MLTLEARCVASVPSSPSARRRQLRTTLAGLAVGADRLAGWQRRAGLVEQPLSRPAPREPRSPSRCCRHPGLLFSCSVCRPGDEISDHINGELKRLHSQQVGAPEPGTRLTTVS